MSVDVIDEVECVEVEVDVVDQVAETKKEEENEDEKCLRKKVTVVVHCKAQRSKGHTSKFFLEHTEKCDAPQPEI